MASPVALGRPKVCYILDLIPLTYDLIWVYDRNVYLYILLLRDLCSSGGILTQNMVLSLFMEVMHLAALHRMIENYCC